MPSSHPASISPSKAERSPVSFRLLVFYERDVRGPRATQIMVAGVAGLHSNSRFEVGAGNRSVGRAKSPPTAKYVLFFSDANSTQSDFRECCAHSRRQIPSNRYIGALQEILPKIQVCERADVFDFWMVAFFKPKSQKARSATATGKVARNSRCFGRAFGVSFASHGGLCP